MSYSPSRVRHMPARALHSAGRLTGVALLAAAGLGLAGQALAGRPLSTDDPNTADTGTCQVELWTERSRGWPMAARCWRRPAGWRRAWSWVSNTAGPARGRTCAPAPAWA